MALTLAVSDNADGTGGVATITGASNKPLTLYRSAFTGTMGSYTWTTSGTRQGNGTITLSSPGTIALGYYLWLALVPADDEVASAYQNLSDAATQSVLDRILDAVKTRIVSLSLSGIASTSVLRQWQPRVWDGVDAGPAVRIAPGSEVVPEGGEYPYAGMGPDWIHAPEPYKRGFIVALTWELIFSDKTGQLLQRAGNGGYYMGLNQEKEVIDAFVDENAGSVSQLVGGHRYHWRDTSYATFQTSAPWINVATSNALVDWTDLNAAEQIANAITDPNTGEPVLIDLDQLVVVKALEATARYVVHSMNVQVNPTGYATSGVTSRYEMENYWKNKRILTSRLLASRMATDSDWYLCNFRKVVAIKVIRPLTVEQAPSSHPANFNRDIVQQWKASRFTKAFVKDPRYVVESRA